LQDFIVGLKLINNKKYHAKVAELGGEPGGLKQGSSFLCESGATATTSSLNYCYTISKHIHHAVGLANLALEIVARRSGPRGRLDKTALLQMSWIYRAK
jgi:hypothetical protein